MKTPTTVLLVVIAALLAANLIVNLPPQEVKAQSHLHAVVPHVIQVEPGAGLRVYRLWSDGVIEEAMFEDVNFDANAGCVPGVPGMAWQVIPEPVPLPHAVNITRIYTHADPAVLLRLRSDGVVEQNYRLGSDVWCGWQAPSE